MEETPHTCSDDTETKGFVLLGFIEGLSGVTTSNYTG